MGTEPKGTELTTWGRPPPAVQAERSSPLFMLSVESQMAADRNVRATHEQLLIAHVLNAVLAQLVAQPAFPDYAPRHEDIGSALEVGRGQLNPAVHDVALACPE